MPMTYHTTDGANIHYLDIGQGQPVLLLHGLGSCGDDWSLQIKALQDDYRVIAPDFRGHGGSSAPDGQFSIAQFADDMLALIDNLGLKDVHVAGLSLGGMVAFEMATRPNANLRSLTIVNSGPHMLLDRFAVKLTYYFRLSAIRVAGLPRLGKIISQKLFPDDDQQALRDLFVRRMSAMNSHAYIRTLKAITSWSVLNKLGQIRCKTLVISADKDYTSVDEKKRYTDLIPDAELKVVENSRHATPLDQPEKLNDLLKQFLCEFK